MAQADEDVDGAVPFDPKAHRQPPARVPVDDDSDLPACPVTVLGHDAGLYAFLSPEGQYRELSARAMEKTGILSLFGARSDWLWRRFPRYDREGKHVGWSLPACQEYLFRAAHERGLFAPARAIRGPGVWRGGGGSATGAAGGGSALIVHSGDAVLIDGAWRDAGLQHGGHWYPLAQKESRPADDPATMDEARQLFDFVGSWSWRAPVHAPRLLLGWMAGAMIAGALAWRPHVQLTGGPGTGKTTLELLLRELLGSTALPVSAPTEAGIRQMLGGAARPVLVDEIETDDMLRARQVVALARLASTDNQAPVSRGSASGKATAWPIRACFLFSSVLHVKFRPQDLSRICVLELDPLSTGERMDGSLPQTWARAEAARLGRLGPGLRRRMIEGWPRFLKNLSIYEAAIVALGQRARVADQLGTLLACAETMLSDSVVSPEAAARLVEDFAIPDLTGHEDEEDHNEFLVHLMSSRVPVAFENGGQRFMTIGELIVRSRGMTGGTYPGELREHGLALMKREGFDLPFLAVANQHQGLAALFRDTRWADGTWSQAAMRCALAFKGGPVSFAGAKVRSTWIPVTSLPIDLSDWPDTPHPDRERYQEGGADG